MGMDFPFEFINKISFTPESVADLLFFAVAMIVAVVSIILFFHWRKYGMGGAILALTELVYLAVSAVLLATAFFSLK